MTHAKSVILLPTFNEVENLAPLTREIFSRLPEVHILVIDDGSTDGTRREADRMAEKYPLQFHRYYRDKKEGLGRAYVAGFQWALERNYDVIFQMDADFSHAPAYLPKLLAKLSAKSSEKTQVADVVIGSRFMEGGGDLRHQWSRKLLSKFGNLYARVLLSLDIADVTGGFKCFRRRALEKLDLKAIESNGFLFQVEMTHLLSQAGCRIIEEPIVFEERKKGSSKMHGGIIWEALWKIFRMRRRQGELLVLKESEKA
jgi:dolichol-phosphate mannosyltransferase